MFVGLDLKLDNTDLVTKYSLGTWHGSCCVLSVFDFRRIKDLSMSSTKFGFTILLMKIHLRVSLLLKDVRISMSRFLFFVSVIDHSSFLCCHLRVFGFKIFCKCFFFRVIGFSMDKWKIHDHPQVRYGCYCFG